MTMSIPGRLIGLLAALVLVMSTAVALTARGAAPPAAPLTAGGPMQLPDDWLNAQRTAGTGVIPEGAFERAAAQALRLGEATAEADPALAGAEWDLVGPTNIGGRVTDIVVDPDLDDTLYVAAASGGVWRSTDAADTFESAWPDDLTQAMGALAVDSTGTLYAATGEANPGGGSSVFGGTGVYRSADRGESWEHIGLEGSGAIGQMIVHPDDDELLFVAATGPLFVPGGERGLYRSTDAGETWELVLEGANDTTGAVDIVVDPRQTDRIYVAMWDRRREPDLRRYGGEGSSIWRSTDRGGTWQRLTTGLPTDADIGRIGLAVASVPDAVAGLPLLGDLPGRVYAIVLDAIGRFRGLYVSLDGGDSWTVVPTGTMLSSSQATYGWWFGEVWVDPVDPLNVFVAGVPLMQSRDGGLTWVSHTGLHADQHMMTWDPKAPGRVYLGNDGGTYRSDAAGAAGTWNKSSYEPYTQFYTVDVGEQDPSRVVGGTQDNGCLRSYPSAWNRFGCGDGLETLINPVDQNIVYGCSQYGGCFRSTSGGGSPTTSFKSRATSSRWNWWTPLVFDPNDPDIMYYGGNRVNRTTDGGLSWQVISPDLSSGVPGRDTMYPWGTLTTIAVSKSDPDVLYAGTDDGLLWTTKDLGQSWAQVDPGQLPGTWVTRVAVDPEDADVAYAVFSGFRLGDDAPHVLRTGDGGDTWTNISGDLPDAPVNDVVLTADGVVVATDVGVFLTRDLGDTWLRVGTGMPLFVPVFDLRYHAPTHALTAATFGRGIYRVALP